MDNSASAMDDQDTTLTHQNGGIEYKFEEVVKFVKNKVIGADGLTLVEVFQALVQMLNGDLELVEQVLVYANIVAKHGMKVAKGSQLSRAGVLRALRGREDIVSRQGFIERSPSTLAIKLTKKKSRGL